MRRLRLSDGAYEEEWLTFEPFQNYYAWCYDWEHNLVYASVYGGGQFKPKISVFKGKYVDDAGTVQSPVIGPAGNWNKVEYNIEKFSQSAAYKVTLLGKNSSTKQWDTLVDSLLPVQSIANINSKKYNYVRLNFDLMDSSLTLIHPMKMKSVYIDYSSLPEISFSKKDLTISPDTVLQGLPVEIKLNVNNFGLVPDSSVNLQLYLNDRDSSFYSNDVTIMPDSSISIKTQLGTTDLLFNNSLKVLARSASDEFFSFNNILQNNFYVSRDSTLPKFNITFDGKQILDGDIISAKPDIAIRLNDNSPLPLDTSDFSISLDNQPISFSGSDISFSYTPYPNSQASVEWKPKLTGGKHFLNVYAKDASGNYFDTTSYRTYFYVYNESGIKNVYNYPNPFKGNTYFTFELTGGDIPQKFLIKIYTIAGRLIRDMLVPSSELQIGFNKILWDGRDQDGDEIANGVYLYKIIVQFNGITKTETQKLAKVR